MCCKKTSSVRSFLHSIRFNGVNVFVFEFGNNTVSIDSGDEVIVGVNKFTLTNPESVEVRMINNTEVLKAQIQSINEVKRTRDQRQV